MERRKTRTGEAARIPFEQAIALRFNHFGEFSDALSANLSTGGMFIRMRRPQPVGSVFEFELRLSDDLPPLAGKAQVAWVRRRSEDADRPIGMGVRFVELGDESRRHIAQMVAVHEAQDEGLSETEPVATPPAAEAENVADERSEVTVAAPSAPQPSADLSSTPAPPPARQPLAAAAPRPVASATTDEVKRRPTRALWVLLTIVLATALAASFWLRPALESPPAASRPSVETQSVDAPTSSTGSVTEGAAMQPEQVRMVNDWARSWSEQRVDDYLDAYSPRFVPPDGLDRGTWERQRRGRIQAPQWIEVGLAFVELEEAGAHRSRVRFVQAYESDGYRDVVRKVLDLERRESGWKILRETVEP